VAGAAFCLVAAIGLWLVARQLPLGTVPTALVGIFGVAILGALVLWAVLWVLFPVSVYSALERIKRTLDQIEQNTRR
jgi:fumarate reductase subunit D